MLLEAGTQYYVSTTGSDGADGLSRATAFRTVAKAYATMTSGDAALILPGTYIHNPDPYVPLTPPIGTVTQGCGVDVTTIRASPSSQRPVVRPNSYCRFLELTIDCDAPSADAFAFGANLNDAGGFSNVTCSRVRFTGGADVIVLLDPDNVRSLRFEECDVEAAWDGITLIDSPLQIDLHRCRLRSIFNAVGGREQRLLFAFGISKSMRVICVDCAIASESAIPNSIPNPVYARGTGTAVHLISTSIQSRAPNGGVTTDIMVTSGATVVVSNSSTFAAQKASGPVAFAPSWFDGADGIETALTLQQATRLLDSFFAGRLSGVGTASLTYRNAVAGSKDRMVVAVDAQGNRTGITYDAD